MELKTLILKFGKFGIVGASGAVIDFGLTALCKGILGIPELLANAIGFTIAATSNYFLNRTWTWKADACRAIWMPQRENKGSRNGKDRLYI